MKKIKVLVSGCYDILHAGHVQFFEDAKALGDHLTVCFASDEVLKMYKDRNSALPEDNKEYLLNSLMVVDEVVKSSDLDPVFDFISHVKKIKPDILAVTEDDKHIAEKQFMCKKYNMKLVILPKRNRVSVVSTSSILRNITRKDKVPLRVDFAGGWLDVPKYSRKDGHIVNCSISPLVSATDWPYEIGSGLGGGAAKAILDIRNGVMSDLQQGAGWQDPAVIEETGLCVWQSGPLPILEAKYNPDWLVGKMLIHWTGKSHVTPDLVKVKRDYNKIFIAGNFAREAVKISNLSKLSQAVNMSYEIQLAEGMDKLFELPKAIAKKYLGSGHGGYALFLFKNQKDRDAAAKKDPESKIIEPYIRRFEN